MERFDYPDRGKADKGLLRRFLVKVAGLDRSPACCASTGPRAPSPTADTKADIGLLAEVAPSRHPLRARHPPALHPGLARVRRPVRAPRRRLQRTSLQLAPLDRRRRGTIPRRPAPCTSPSASFGSRPRRPRRSSATRSPRRTSLELETPCLAPVLEALLRVPLQRPRIPRRQRWSSSTARTLLEALHIDEFSPVPIAQRQRPRSVWHLAATSPAGMQNASTPSQQVLSPYLFHRPCLFPVEVIDAKGCVRKRYPHANVMTSYDKLLSRLPTPTDCTQAGDLLRPVRRRRRRHERQRRGTRPQPSSRPTVRRHRHLRLKDHGDGRR